MMISTRGRYALRFLIALSRTDGFTPLSDIALSEEISPKYLERIVQILSKNGIIESQRGKEGGYRLKVSPSLLSVRDVLSLTEESLAPVECLCSDINSCHRREECPTLPMWEALYRNNMEFFSHITLENLKNGEISI